ncbi:MAG: uroporphyrinogen decarboxylase [Spirochaetaceae bacterium]|nr:MAG: uroporphyrinogen decarboxylase [Spirochaetaceae bacterium]
MNKREVIRDVLDHKKPLYVPWSFGFTKEAKDKLHDHFGADTDLEEILGNHLLKLGGEIGFFDDVGPDLVRDVFGVVWDRSIDKDIGDVRGCVLERPTLKGYEFPDPIDPRFFEDIPAKIARHGDRFRVFQIGFSLWERAWTLRGFANMMTDFYDYPGFVKELLNTIADYNIAQLGKAMHYDIDAVYFGDDWGQQRGLQMGPKLWREFIFPVLKRMYGAVKRQDRYVIIHSCGDVDELFDDLVAIGLNCFNPFQPEVMNIHALMDRYRGSLSFYGGLSTQKTLPYGSVADVRAETVELIERGRSGDFILSPAHDVEGDVPLENMLAFIETAQEQLQW